MDLGKYKFSDKFTSCPASEFKQKVKQRYKSLSAKEVNELVEREYGKQEEEKKEKLDGNSSPIKAKAGASKE